MVVLTLALKLIMGLLVSPSFCPLWLTTKWQNPVHATYALLILIYFIIQA